MNESELPYFALEVIKSLISKMYEMRFSIDKSVSYSTFYKIRRKLNGGINKDKLEKYLKKYFEDYGYSIEIESLSIESGTTVYAIYLPVTLTINKNITKESELVSIIEKMKKDINNIDDTELKLLKEKNKMNRESESNLVMPAEEARVIANKRNNENLKVDYYLLHIGKLIGKVAEEGRYTIVYNIELNVDEKIVTRVIDYLKSLGYRVTETDNEYFRKLIIEFN